MRVWRDLVQRAEREAWSYRDFLTLLVTEEIAHRQQTRLGRLTRRAHFPYLKTIDDFTFTYQSMLRLHMLGSALAADFVTEGRSLIFSGKHTWPSPAMKYNARSARGLRTVMSEAITRTLAPSQVQVLAEMRIRPR